MAARIARALDRIAPPGAIGVALSGGGDSCALLAAAMGWAQARGRLIEAATVDHRLRPGSAQEADAAAALAADLGIAHERLTRAGPPLSANLQAEARAARLSLLAGWAARRGLSAVALGHTRDDQAETVLLRLARGSGVDGLSAMAESTRHHGTLWLRPMLGLPREALRGLLRARGIGWSEDPSNDDPRFDRVRVRRALAALAPLGITAEGLAETAARLSDARAVVAVATEALAAEARVWGALGEVRLSLGPMRAAGPYLATRLLGETLRLVAGAEHPPRQRALTRLWEAVSAGAPGASLGGTVVVADGPGVIRVSREPAALGPPVPARDGAVWDGRWQLAVSAPMPGAEIGALGPEGLAALRAMGGERGPQTPQAWAAAPASLRHTVPAIRVGVRLVAVPMAQYFDDGDKLGGGKDAAISLADLARVPFRSDPAVPRP